ncbi:MAG TPA: HAD family phosphatase [Gammaproteobacteria bacterium]|nr:HAD family phosphatase [Gammaproteobacteria bacterium]
MPNKNLDMSNPTKGQRPSAMVVTDLDGTLLNSVADLSPTNRETLQSLAANNIIRVAATGRSLWSALNVIDTNTPLDYLVFTSGAGIVNWPECTLLYTRHLSHKQVLNAALVLREFGCDFMLHASVPENHHFWYHRQSTHNPDFQHRIEHYRSYCKPWPDSALTGDTFSQLLVIQHPNHQVVNQPQLTTALAPLNVIRTTSPLDHTSTWFEIFPPQVSKASGIQWLADRYHLNSGAALVIGNDYNDLQMLEWAQRAAVVANAPIELCQRFEIVPGNDEDGFSVAVHDWLATWI